MRALLLLIIVVVVGACAPPPRMEPLPYRFTIRQFADARPAAAYNQATAQYPFTQKEFLENLRAAMPYSMFGSEDAGLALTLTHYEATHYNDSFAVSMVMEMHGTDQYARPLAKRPIMCSSVEGRGFELDDYAQQVWADKNLDSLSSQERDRKMWQRVFGACVRELADKFGQIVVQQQTAGQPTE